MGADGSQSQGNNTNVPPPFLTKTYDMIDDPATDEIVSWSDNNCSFVVWNVSDFAKDLLPQYFKHNNFSSFVRQLNTYGFHKIEPDRWEFFNEGFSRGNKEALKNIHRRKPVSSSSQAKDHSSITCTDPSHADLEEQIRRLKHDKSIMVMELLKLREKQKTTEIDLHTVGTRLQLVEERQQQIVRFLAHIMQNSGTYVQNSMSLSMGKRRRMLEHAESDDSEQLLTQYPSEDDISASESNGVNNDLGIPIETMLRQFANSHLKSADDTSPLSCTSNVRLWELPPSKPVSPSGSVRAIQSAPVSPSKLSECGDYTCQSFVTPLPDNANGALSNKVEAGGSSSQVENRVDIFQSSYPGTGKANAKVEFHHNIVDKSSGSNDMFWESMLNETPLLSDKGQERWFM